MTTPKSGSIVPPPPLRPLPLGRASAGQASSARRPAPKPTGPIIYKIDNGSNVWPAKK